MIAWCIWNNQNNCVWNGLKDTPKSVAMRVAHMMNEWQVVNTRQQLRQTENSSTTDIWWQQPRSGWRKCNVDASFHDESDCTGWGWCLRNRYNRQHIEVFSRARVRSQVKNCGKSGMNDCIRT
ncbi:polynucleotidyl transferase ribonuclease H fold, partial [Trifolium medium]|nr:polynucleotidyl transferase ribonuclease H fold [Trifolium medium]